MKIVVTRTVTTTEVEAEGSAEEIRTGLPSVLGLEVPAAGANTLTGPSPESLAPSEPAYVVEANEVDAEPLRTESASLSDEGADASDPRSAEGRAGRPATSHPAPQNHDEPSASIHELHPGPDFDLPDSLPYDCTWEDIPPKHRGVSQDPMGAMHIRTEPDGKAVLCGERRVGIRPQRVPVAGLETVVEVCGACRKRLNERNAKATAERKSRAAS